MELNLATLTPEQLKSLLTPEQLKSLYQTAKAAKSELTEQQKAERKAKREARKAKNAENRANRIAKLQTKISDAQANIKKWSARLSLLTAGESEKQSAQ